MKKVSFSKQNLTRLSMVINNFGNATEDILTKCIIYLIYEKGEPIQLNEIIDCLRRDIGEFDESEIQSTLLLHEEFFIPEVLNNITYYDITAKARILYQHKEKSFFDISIENFKNEKGLILGNDEIKQLIFDYLYKCISVEFNLFNIIIDEDNNKETDVIDSKAEIINQYFIWAKNKKDDTIYRILMAILDFCHLSANINAEQIKAFLGNKKFYLDANVIFRLMGINNDERQRSISSFIEKCKMYGIEIYVTNLTDKEIKNVFKHYADIICSNYDHYKGKGEINNYLGINDNTFSDLYLKWKNENGIYSKEDFINDLIDSYKKSIKDFKKVTIPEANIKIKPEFKQSYIQCHNNSFEQSIDTDLFNIQFVYNNRVDDEDSLINTVSYLITEDKKLIQWSNDNISAFNCVATFPSQWYTLFLSLGSRYVSLEEKVSFNNFLMIDTSFRINKVDNEELKKKVIKTVNSKVENGELQDRIFKKLQTIDIKEHKKEEKLNEIIHETTIQFNKEQKELGYNNGYSKAKDDAQTELKILLDKYMKQENDKYALIPIQAKNIRFRNILIIISPIIIALLLWVIVQFAFNKNNILRIIIVILLIISERVLCKIYPIDINKCIELEKNDLESSDWYRTNREHINSLKSIIK